MALLGDKEFSFIAELVSSRSRISLGPDKKALVAARLHKRLQQLNYNTFSEYCDFLKSPQGTDETRILVDLISTNFTYFFREPEHFEFMKEHILPAWVATSSNRGRSYRVWSAGCSTGEEPFSIAIALGDFFKNRPTQWHIDATDVSKSVLNRAELGLFTEQQVRRIPKEQLRQNFLMGTGPYHGHYKVKSSLKSKVTFRQLNLFQPQFPFEAYFDVIFCRNVMIYFERETQMQLCHRLTEWLRPGGFLIVGHSEGMITTFDHNLRRVIPSVWEKNPNPRNPSKQVQETLQEKTTE